MDLAIDRLARSAVPDATRLSTQAGWNQVPADWHRLIALEPEGCFAGRLDGELVATGTLLTHDDQVGWVGMILVDADHRHRGYGTAMFDRVLELAEARGVTAGLDATDAGREVYRKRDFVDVTPIERWGGELSSVDSPSRTVSTLQDQESTRDAGDASTGEAGKLDDVCTLDRRAVGVDRSRLLRQLLGEDGTTTLTVGEEMRGYAVVRPGREHDHLGPLVASERADARALVTAAADVVEESVLVDVLDLDFAGSVLEPMGLAPRRRLTRMAAEDPEPLLVGEGVRAAAGFELG